MRILNFKLSTKVLLPDLLSLAVAGGACKPATETNTNANAASTNANTNTNTNTNTSADMGPVINTREPEKYQATLVATSETSGGDKTLGMPTLSATVARNGADHRIAFKLPNGEQLIYLDHAGKHYVIAVNRKQYAELTQEATGGVQIQNLMTPGQIVAYLQKQPGYVRVGDEKLGDRTTDKYRYAGTTKTGTTAGDVSSEAFVYVDKETSLPLRSELNVSASGNVEGVKGGRVVLEMNDINLNVDPSMFELPQGYTEVKPEQVRQQVDALTTAAAAILKALLGNIGAQSTTTVTTTTTASPSPTASASPK